MIRTVLRVLLPLCVLATACVELDDAPLDTESTASPISQLGVERVIPVRFYLLDNAARDCATPLPVATVAGALREANTVFLPAGVQFRLAGLRTYTTPSFRAIDDTQGTVAWGAVWSELNSLVPTTASMFAGRTALPRAFFHAIATRMEPSEIPVFVPCSLVGADYSSFPWSDTSAEFWGDNSRVMVISRAAFGDPASTGRGFVQQTLSHELGHYLGLPHPFDLMALIGKDGAGEDFHELFYQPTVDGGIRLLASKAEVLAVPRAQLRIKSGNGTGPGGTAQCSASAADGNLTCSWNGRTYRTSTHPRQLEGLGFAYEPGAPLGVNLMDYLTVPASTDPVWNARASLSATQIARVRSVLRGSRGKRNLLGRGAGSLASLRPYGGWGQEMDFTGDGLRDLAYFDWSNERCVVRHSGTGAQSTISLASTDLAQGDTPITGDFDRDGRIDCAVFRPGTGSGNAKWIYRGSRAPGAMTSVTFGSLGDVPFANVRIKTASSPSMFGVFTPSTGTFWWRVGSSNWSVPLGSAASQLVLGDYDLDGFTDLATWQPVASGATQMRLSVRLSSEDYGTEWSHDFGELGDVPLGAVKRTSVYPTFAVWRPRTGEWFYLDRSSGTYTSEGWGEATDLPMPGFDFDNDGLADAAVYRPGSGGATLGALWVRGSGGVSKRFNVGVAGDVPFFGRDENGDGVPELYLYRPATGTYYWVPSSGFSFPTLAEIRFGSYVFPPL